ncbi:acyl-ACP desaturase [Streptomyces sp. NPDC046215]|uniref:acyl-ACP desaturase n=1 Tax=Streptomyces TaxID=1883 RepID=UPI0031D8312D
MLAELEPWVARNLDRHLAATPTCYPHQHVPWGIGSGFAGPLGGRPWQPEEATLPQAVRDALIVNPLTEDNLPSYHHKIATRFGREGAWGTWVHRWNAEEDRYAHALRAYLTTTRAVDPVALEQCMRHLCRGFAYDRPSVLHALAYVTVQELATRVAHRNAGQHCPDAAGAALMARVAADENLHMIFYRDVCRTAADILPDLFLRTYSEVLEAFRMPGQGTAELTARAARIAAAGISDVRVHHEQVVLPLVRHLGLMDRTGLGPVGEQAHEALARYLEDLRRRSASLEALRPRLTSPARAGVPTGRDGHGGG